MDQDSANLDFSLSQPADSHVAMAAEDGGSCNNSSTRFAHPIPAFICLYQGCEASFPAAGLLEAHAIIHDKGYQTSNTVDDSSVAAGHLSAHRLHHGFGYSPPTIYTTPTGSLSGTVNDAPTGFCNPNYGWPNASNPVGISGYDYTNPVPNMPSKTLTAIGDAAFTQEIDPFNIASHGPYDYGHSRLTTAAPPLTRAVAQTSNVANATGSTQPGVICAICGMHVARQSDLGRHMKKHQPDAQVYRCQVPGCQYSSKRKDKVMEHSRRPH